MRVLVGVNVLANVHALAYGNHCKFWFQCARTHPNDYFQLFAPPRMSIDRMRNECSKLAMSGEFDILVFIDDDVTLPNYTFKQLMKNLSPEKPIIAGLTYIRGYPYRPMLFKKQLHEGKQVLNIFDDFKDHTPTDAMVLCDAVGFSFVGIHVSLLLKIPPPHFITGTMNTEDVYFCCKVKEKFPEIPIFCDTMIKTGHIGENIILHDSTVEKFREIEKAYPMPESENPRSKEFLEKKKESFRSIEDIVIEEIVVVQ